MVEDSIGKKPQYHKLLLWIFFIFFQGTDTQRQKNIYTRSEQRSLLSSKQSLSVPISHEKNKGTEQQETQLAQIACTQQIDLNTHA